MKLRVISALIALPLMFFVVYLGGNILLAASLIVSLIGLFEFYRAYKNIGINSFFLVGYGATVIYYMTLYFGLGPNSFMFLLFIMVILLMSLCVFYTKYNDVDAFITLGGFLYVSFNFSHIFLITHFDAKFLIWYVFILAWVTDTSAYFAGYFFGNHKLIPEVSPKKTVEGAVGGVLGATLFSVAFAFIFNKEFLYFSLFLGLFGSILSQIGDLIASRIKRHVGIKDFGKIMPGHGGILDRFDSILVTAPLTYYFALFFYSLK